MIDVSIKDVYKLSPGDNITKRYVRGERFNLVSGSFPMAL